MVEKLEIGRAHTVEITVTKELTADAYGNPGVFVYATPALIHLVEMTAFACLAATLEGEQGSLGIRLDVRHLAATPLGMKVRCTAVLTEIDRRRLVFTIEAYDEQEQIASGTHERFVIDSVAKFVEKANAKLGSATHL
ncbi:MAG: thioesterase [Ardenticatenaceae bacterium]|nr:thioesterase [Ardenticatenaceae bacterium]